MNRRFILIWLVGCAALAVTLVAQSGFPFQILVQVGSNTAAFNNGSTFLMQSSGLGKTISATVTATYVGRTKATLSAPPQLTGSTDFTVGSIGSLPISLDPGQAVKVIITYVPTSTQGASAQFAFAYTEAAATADQAGTSGIITLNVIGVVPNLTLNYALVTDGNVTPLPDGGTLQFMPTLVNTTTTTTVIIANSGSGPGTVNSINVSGDAFQPLGIPLLPSSVASGGTLNFQIRYSPKKIGSDQGTLTIAFQDRTVTAALNGSGIGTAYSYSIVNGSTLSPILPNGQIGFPDTPVGQTSKLSLQVQNTGNASGVVSGVVTSGSGFSVSDAPAFPTTLAPNALFTVTLNFTPTQSGPATGRLTIGSDVFILTGNGIGPSLVFSYDSGAGSTTVSASGTILFSPVQVGQKATAQFTIRNTGTSAASISSIGLSNNSPPVFSLSNIPPLPLTLNANDSVTIAITFAPTGTGQFSAALLVNAQTFTVSGFGTPPPDLPPYQITGLTGPVNPFDQPAVGLTLAAPYPVPVTGTLTIVVDSATPDPAVQFETGGRTVAFTIAANSTQAIFPNGLSRIRVQTGTVAGNISITPSFATQSGYNLTPASASPLLVTVPQLAPHLLTVQLTSSSSTGFTLTITGYTTTRKLSKLSFQFTAASGVNLSQNQVSVDISQVSSGWFANPVSQSSGGQFSVTIPFTLQITGASATTTPLSGVSSVAVTATNDVGTSNSLSATLQ